MLKAVLNLVRKEDGTTANFPVGNPAVIDLFCTANNLPVKKVFKNVFLTAAFSETENFVTGSQSFTKIINPCANTFAYTKTSIDDLLNLQNCCTSKMNHLVKLACSVVGSVKVVNVLGSEIGTASSTIEYATKWNADVNNQLVGVLYPQGLWKFILNHNTGNILPLNLPCVAAVVIPCANVVISDITPTGFKAAWAAVQGATKYLVELFKVGQVQRVYGAEQVTLENVLTDLTPNSNYKLYVSSYINGDYNGGCVPTDVTTLQAETVFNSILNFNQFTQAALNGVTAQTEETNPNLKIEFDAIDIEDQSGLPTDMEVNINGNLVFVITFPADYVGRALRITDEEGIKHNTTFIGGTRNL